MNTAMQLVYLCLGMLAVVLIWDLFAWLKGGAGPPKTTIQWVSVCLKVIAFAMLLVCLPFL